MANLRLVMLFHFMLYLHTQLVGGGEAREFRIRNNCSYTIWPAYSYNGLEGGNLSLETHQSRVMEIPSGASPFKLWAQTNCTQSKTNSRSLVCQTGQCVAGNIPNCSQSASTLLEFNLNSYQGADFYDVSLINGYNIPVAVVPEGGTGSDCAPTGCVYDVGKDCPQELRLGDVCQSPCDKFNNPVYCCDSTQTKCQPTVYSKIFKNTCPRVYTYALDDATTVFTCQHGSAYAVTFCPTSTTLLRELSKPFYSSGANSNSSPASTPSPTPSPSPHLVLPTLSLSPTPTRISKKMNKSHVTIAVVIAVPMSTAMLILLFLAMWILMKRKKARERDYALVEDINTMESFQFDISTVRAATNNFSIDSKLGEGGFGEVYKGKLESGKEVAVKRLLQNSKQGVTEFKTEVVLVAKLQHKNLVRLLGFCVTSKEKILVYEYLPNSSLDRYLFDQTSHTSLGWQTRLNIIIGIARGLMYLHEDSRFKVIHRDLKTSNILLDNSMNPKISDFGLARLFGDDQTHGDTKRIVGTYGYMAPEYAITGHYSVKSDIYSFGVIVLEIISGRKNRFFGGLQEEEALLHRAWRLWNESKPLDLVDTGLSEDFSPEELIRCYHIGLLCIQEDAIQRPGMRLVLDALIRPSTSLPEPTAPRFFGNPAKPDEGHHTLPHSYTGTEAITVLHPRD